MKTTQLNRRILLATLAFALLLPIEAVFGADKLDALRSSGAVGERYDGFLVARDGAAKATVDQVNSQRRKIYEKRAKEASVPVEQIGEVYAGEIMEDAPKGTYFLQKNGEWVRK